MKKIASILLAVLILCACTLAMGEADVSLESLLPMGRWVYSGETGMTFFEFNADHTGNILGMVQFTWAVDGDTVALDYNSQGKDYHVIYALKIGSGVYTLQNTEDEKMLFVLQGVSAPSGTESAENEVAAEEVSLESLLPTGRWNYTREVGSSFFEFGADGTGSILNMIPFTWVADGNTVALDYNSQGMDWHLIFELQQDESGVYSLVNVDNADQVFVLEAEADPLLNVIGVWKAPLADGEAVLDISADATCTLQIGGQTYNATWSMDETHVYLNQNGSIITCDYDGQTLTAMIGEIVLNFTK